VSVPPAWAISANGAPTSAQPIAFASSLTARRYFRISSARALGDDQHSALPLLFIALTPVLGPLLRSLLPGHLHQSRNNQSKVIARSPWRATAGMSGRVQTYGTTAKNKNTAKITK
jgi:hypothetical protein